MLDRVHTTTLPLLNDSGLATRYKRCNNPELHKSVTFYRSQDRASVCDICNEDIDYFIHNLWRYPPNALALLRKILNLPEEQYPLWPSETVIEAPEKRKSTECVPDIVGVSVEPLGSSGEDMEYCECKRIAEFVGMDGEPLCRVCWNKLLSVA